VNVANFKASHPGGRFLIDHNIGRDISKFFYGGYVLETQTKQRPYAHSNKARFIIHSIAIGRLDERSKTFSARIQDTLEVPGPATKVFVFKIEGPDPGFRLPASTDLSSMGKHFLVRSFF
jgi:hypothetical protein